MKAVLFGILFFTARCSHEGLRDVVREYHQSPVKESHRRAYTLALACEELGQIRGFSNLMVQILYLEAQLATGKIADIKTTTEKIPT